MCPNQWRPIERSVCANQKGLSARSLLTASPSTLAVGEHARVQRRRASARECRPPNMGMTAGTCAGHHPANADDSRAHRLTVSRRCGRMRLRLRRGGARQARKRARRTRPQLRHFGRRRAEDFSHDEPIVGCELGASASAVVIVSAVPALTASIRAATSAAHASSVSASCSSSRLSTSAQHQRCALVDRQR
jgi:hypothetical protein